MRIDVIGVYPVEESHEPCHLVELIIHGHGQFRVGDVTQEAPDQPSTNWQVPYDEHFVDADGGVGAPIDLGAPIHLNGPKRIAFFFHCLALDRPLLTPAGAITLPTPSSRPPRLLFLRYEPPC